MNIDDYLNELQTNLDDQLSKFGVNSSDESHVENADEKDDKTFCPECGTSIPDGANFCPNCGYKVTSSDEEDDDCQNEEKPTRTVEVSIWTPGLNLADIRPVSREFANKCIEEGEVSDDVYDDFEFSIPVYFCDNQEVNITVKDGEKEKKYTDVRLNGLDFGIVSDDLDLDIWCDRDDYDSDEEYAEALKELRYEEIELYSHWLKNNINLDEASYTFQQFWNACLEGYGGSGGMNDYLKHVSKEAIDNGEDEDMVNYLELGEIGKGEITFRIEIPEDEEFDLKKLHFIEGGDIEDFPEGFDVFLSTWFKILDDVEYDGRIYCEKEVFFAPGWRDYYGGRFYNADLTEFEPD